MEVAQQVRQRGQVEHVAQALAVGLEDDREAGEVTRHLEQALRLQPLLPERRALAGVGARDQQRAGGVLAEAGAEQGRAGELADDQVLELVGLDQDEVGGRRLVGVGEVDDDAVVGPDRVGLEVALGADLGGEGEAPGGVDAAAVGGEDAEAPVADLVAEALDHDRLVGGDDAGRRLLLAQVGDEVLGGAAVEVVLGGQLGRLARDRLAGEGADRPAQLGRAADPVALPEGDRARGAGGRGDDDPVAGDLLDPPGGGAEQEGLAGAGLVDHLLVELADPAAVGQVDAVEAAVGDRAGVGDDQLAGAFAAVHRAGGAVPDDPRAQLGEAVGGVAAVEHVEHVLQLLAGEVVEGLGGGDQALDLVDLPLVQRRHRDQVLGEHVERVLRDHRLLDLPFAHAAGRPPRTRAGRRGTWGRCGHWRPRPRPWPARPIRCRPRVTDFGDSTWITRSTAPMSIPSSREEVATRQGSWPDLSISSTTVRSSWDREPWWARAISSIAAGPAGPAHSRPAEADLERPTSGAS